MAPVAILGAGSVGRALGERLVRAGVDLCFGVRDPASAARGLTGPLADVPALPATAAVIDAEIIFLAVPAPAAVAAAGSADSLRGKTLLDCTNPVRWDGGPIWAPPPAGSVAQELAAAFPGTSVIKGFNHFGAEVQRSPQLMSGPADAFFAGNDPEAKASVMELATRMGFLARDAGPLRNAALLENLAVLWIHFASVGGMGRNFGYRMERQAHALV